MKLNIFNVKRNPARAKQQAADQARDFARKRAIEAKRRLAQLRQRAEGELAQ